ncbi:hypothetical protein [Roseateles asaccharophilus]|uniref:Uncharacterized protein n=1 Tax=Roseateles asaccharophilus TaxID=582607 RepID=A0ABU2A472_9BURK|nr:hypothetical protein [Roseateles asaccharophilus]MDR7332001.1 hypothetical protein [Roseateles asaccharophilus]
MKTRTRKLLAELHDLLDGPDDDEMKREVFAFELVAAALLMVSSGKAARQDVEGAASEFVERLRAFPREQWSALFDQARTAACCTTANPRREVLEQLITAVQAAGS